MERKYASPTADSTFKLIFGEEQHKRLTIDFLNNFLERQNGKLITDISFMNQEQTPRRRGDKKSILDIHCKDQAGHRFIIEMQTAREEYFDLRALYYAASLLSRQLGDAEPYNALKPVIVIGILEQAFNKEDSQVVSHNLICDMRTGKQSLNLIEIHLIELSKFKKTSEELESQIDKWLYFLKNAANLYEIPDFCKEPSVIKEAFDLVERAKWSRAQTELYESEIREIRKNITQELAEIEAREKNRIEGLKQGLEQGLEKGLEQGLQQGIQQGIQKGIEQGLEQGRQKEKEAMAIKLLNNGIDLSVVSDLTGLSIDFIKQLRQ